MRARVLKAARITASLLFFVAFLFIFLAAQSPVAIMLARVVAPLQFIPSLISFFTFFSVSAAFFIVIIAVTMLFGRVYCSSLCPLGTLQDILIYLKKRLNRRRRATFRYSGPLNPLRYVLMIFTAIMLLAGTVTAALLLDPYSLFGRMAGSMAAPATIWCYNQIASLFTYLNILNANPADYPYTAWPAFSFSLAVFFLVAWLSVKKGRLFCNSICPVGTFLGLLARISLFRIRIDAKACTLCGACITTCKACCIDIKKTYVDFSRCVGCMNCLSSCTEKGIDYELSFMKILRNKNDHTSVSGEARRKLLKAVLSALPLAGVAPLTAGVDAIASVPTKPGDQPRRKAITPPGSLGREYFTQHCTACHLCVAHCPTHVLVPSLFEYGITGIFQPLMNYPSAYCLYDCIACIQVCPTGAIQPVNLTQKKTIQIGKSRLIENLCIVVTKGTACGACSEHCPTKACDMVPYKGTLTIPRIDTSICIGCGACEHPCPTQPKAIVVDENDVHLTARPPLKKQKKQINNQSVIESDAFPF